MPVSRPDRDGKPKALLAWLVLRPLPLPDDHFPYAAFPGVSVLCRLLQFSVIFHEHYWHWQSTVFLAFRDAIGYFVSIVPSRQHTYVRNAVWLLPADAFWSLKVKPWQVLASTAGWYSFSHSPVVVVLGGSLDDVATTTPTRTKRTVEKMPLFSHWCRLLGRTVTTQVELTCSFSAQHPAICYRCISNIKYPKCSVYNTGPDTYYKSHVSLFLAPKVV